MKGLAIGNISYNPLEEGAIQPSSIKTCSCSQNKSGILFYKSNSIHIENLAIEDCGTKSCSSIQYQDRFHISECIHFYDSYNIEVVRMRLNRNIGYGMIADRVFNLVTSLSQVQLFPKYIGRNARFWYAAGDAHMPSINKLLIEHSWFLYAGQNGHFV